MLICWYHTFSFQREGIGELTPQQAKPARYAANLAEIEQVPFCAITRPRLQCYAEMFEHCTKKLDISTFFFCYMKNISA